MRFQMFCALFFVVTLFTIQISANNPSTCDREQTMENPCRCCKMECWYSIAKGATHELGHIPGQAGEDEALATLKLIRSCMVEECRAICGPPQTPFRPAAMIAMAEARKRLQL